MFISAITRLSQHTKTTRHKDFQRAWTKHDEKARLLLSLNMKYKNQGRTQNVQNIDSKHNIIMKTWKK
jgi:hypothetical protein